MPENTPPQTDVFTFEVDDPDIGQLHACSVKEANSIFVTSMNADDTQSLVLASNVNYETVNVFNVTLKCSDGEFSIEKVLSCFNYHSKCFLNYIVTLLTFFMYKRLKIIVKCVNICRRQFLACNIIHSILEVYLQTVTVNVQDVNEAPTAIRLSGSNTVLADAETDHVIGTFTVDDEDKDQTHMFTITGQNSDILVVRRH